ncbi:MAG: hypothetical protein ACXIUB_02110 [Wenzhouxiangella sp.]
MMLLRRPVVLLIAALLLSSPATAENQRLEFDELLLMLQQALNQAGSGHRPGDRSELFRQQGPWQMTLAVIWMGDSWLPLVLEVRHEDEPDRPREHEWEDRQAELLASLDRRRLDEYRWPDLLGVDAPGWNPALPEEYRRRRFTHEGFWFELSWVNEGGFDDSADWVLRSYRAVALPLPVEGVSRGRRRSGGR